MILNTEMKIINQTTQQREAAWNRIHRERVNEIARIETKLPIIMIGSSINPLQTGARTVSEDTQQETSAATATPGVVSIKVKSKKTDREVTFERNFGDTLEDSVALFGADTVHDTFVAQVVIRAQSAARNVLDDFANDGTVKFTSAQAIEAGVAYTPGVARARGGVSQRDPYATMVAKVVSGKMTAEEVMAELQLRLASAGK